MTFRPNRLPLLAVAFVSLFALAASDAAKPTKQQRIRALRQRLKQLSGREARQRTELRQTKRTQRRLADQLNESYQQLETANESLKTTEERLARAEQAVHRCTARLQEAEADLKLQQQRFGRRIAHYYQEGPTTYVDVLLGARDMSDLLDRQYYVSKVMDQDASVVSRLRSARERVASEREQLLDHKASVAAAHAERARQVALVAERTSGLETLARSIQQERALQEQRLGELEEDSGDVERALAREQARRQANPRAYRSYGRLPRWSGSFTMPARGPITSGFGYRTHPILKYRRLHTGLDIGAGMGAPVYAAADGEVFFASWRGGYGRCIIVLHGGEVSTLYGHLSRIDVSAGQRVRRGQRIGAVGSTGLSTGPHLHFEVRRNGVPVNPL